MKNTKRAGIVSASAATLIVGGVAFAAWTSTGTATGSVTAGEQTGLTSVAAANTNALYPTQSKDVTINFTNRNSYPVRITSLVQNARSVSGGIGTGDGVCTDTNSGVTWTTPTVGSNDFVPAGRTITYVVTASMTAASADGCQKATFGSSYTATSESTPLSGASTSTATLAPAS